MNKPKPKKIESGRNAPSLQDAQQMADILVAAYPAIDAIMLFGSVARGDASEWSDVDLIVISSDSKLTPELIRKALSKRTERTSIIYYPTSLFVGLYQERALFIAHLKKEGVILYDRLKILENLLSKPFKPSLDVAKELKTYRMKLAPYSDPRRFNNNFLFCLSHLYSIGKDVVMLGLAKQGDMEFNREEAFRRFAQLYPDLVAETKKIAELRSFHSLVTHRRPERMPYSFRTAGKKVKEAVVAIEELAKRAESI